MATLQDYFHLTKDSFSIDPQRDAEQFFGRRPLQTQVRDRLEQDFLDARRVPKFFLFGRYGSGKTHALAHIDYVLRTDSELRSDYGATSPIMTSMPPLKSKSSWLDLHQHLADELGRQRVTDAARAVLQPVMSGSDDLQLLLENEGVLRFGDTALRASQAQVFRNLCFGGSQASLSWEWLKGKALSMDAAHQLNTETNLSTVPSQVAALLNMAALVAKGTGQKVVFLIDEAESLRDVTSADAEHEFLWALREVFSDSNDVLGLIVAFQTEGGQEGIPPMLDDDSVRSRVGYDAGYIDLATLLIADEDVKEFVREAIVYLVDQDAARRTIEAEDLDTEPEDFPFTAETIDLLAEHILEDPERQVPRRILRLMSEAVKHAYRAGKNTGGTRLIDSELLEIVFNPGSDL